MLIAYKPDYIYKCTDAINFYGGEAAFIRELKKKNE